MTGAVPQKYKRKIANDAKQFGQLLFLYQLSFVQVCVPTTDLISFSVQPAWKNNNIVLIEIKHKPAYITPLP